MKETIAVFAALGGLAVACLSASFPPTSGCSEFNGVNLQTALAFLGLYTVAGLYAALKGTTTERLILVLGTALIMGGYFTLLRATLPDAIKAEISCVNERALVEPTRATP